MSSRLGFEHALEHIKNGGKVRREGWKGRHKWIELHPDTPAIMSFLLLVYQDGTKAPWFPNRCDLLEEDWVIVEPSAIIPPPDPLCKDLFKKIRKTLGLTQHQAATISGVTQGAISKMDKNGSVTIQQLALLARSKGKNLYLELEDDKEVMRRFPLT